MSRERGCYLALEGVEGAGKSTVAEALAAHWRTAGRAVTVVREPGGTPLGEKVRELLLHSADMTPWAEAALFAAQRAQLTAEVVAPALQGGEWVVADRSFYSSLAYQGVGRGLGIGRVRTLNELALDGVIPDLVFVLDVDPRTGLERQQELDRIGRAGIDFGVAVAEAYHVLASAEPDRVLVITPGSSANETARMIAEIVERRWTS